MKTAVLATTLVGFGGLAAETAFWYAQKRALQTQADAAALSGAYELLQGNAANAASWATNDATLNGFNNTSPNAISSTCNGTSCQVTLTLQHSTSLARRASFGGTSSASTTKLSANSITLSPWWPCSWGWCCPG